MKLKLIILTLSMIVSLKMWPDDHTDYVHFRDEASTLIHCKDYKKAEQKLESADFFAVSSQDKSDLAHLRNEYNKRLKQEIDSARAQYKRKRYEDCISILMPLEGTVQDKAIQYWLGNSYANMGMLVLGKKYLESGIDKYNDAMCAYSLGWWYRHSDKKSIGISFDRAKELLVLGASATNASYDELGALYEDISAYSEAVGFYKQSNTKKGTSSISHLILGGYVHLPNEEALSYIIKAANDGDLESIYGLGLITYYGQYGVTADRKRGRELVYEASQKGHKKAITTLYNLKSY